MNPVWLEVSQNETHSIRYFDRALSAFFGREQSTDTRRANTLRPGTPTGARELRQVDWADADTGHDGNASTVVDFRFAPICPAHVST